MDAAIAGSTAAAAIAESGPLAIWIAAGVVGLAGLAVGLLLGRLGSGARRARQLEHDLREAQEEMARYRDRVSDHFGETSRLLRDLTLRYRSVYEHLAGGARELCPEGERLLAPSLAEAARPTGEATRASNAASVAAEEPLELEIGGRLRPASGAFGGEGARAGLEPILEERVPEKGELTAALRRAGAEP